MLKALVTVWSVSVRRILCLLDGDLIVSSANPGKQQRVMISLPLYRWGD